MGLFGLFKRKPKEVATLAEKESTQQIVGDIPESEEPPVRKISHYIREMRDGLNLVYRYGGIKFSANENFSVAIKSMESKNKWETDLSLDEDRVVLSYDGIEIGTLIDRSDMVRDFINRNETVLAGLETNSPTENSLVLSFYRDERKRLSKRENEVVKLTRYSNRDAQDVLVGLKSGYKLDFDPDYDYNAPDDTVFITFGGALGALPKKQSRRYLEEGAAGVFLEEIDYDIEKDKDILYVRIFW